MTWSRCACAAKRPCRRDDGPRPTGKRITWTENEIRRFEDGLAVESWGEGTLDAALVEVGLDFQEHRRDGQPRRTEMAIVMVTEGPGADASMVEGMKQAGVLDAMAGSRGFGGHWSGATGSGYRVIEVWDSSADWQARYDNHIQPNLPPGAEPNPPELFELNLQIKPAD